MKMRHITVIAQDVLSEGGRALASPTRRVVACAAVHNPYAGGPPIDDFSELVDISYAAGEVLTRHALAALAPLSPRGYGKAALVGAAGDLEHGGAMIHVRIGLAMRQGAGGGPALIPGNAKVGGIGASIDLVFGGIEDGWDYDAMDTMTISVADAPKPDEILLAVGFLAGTRPNARIEGVKPEVVADLVRDMRRGS